MPRINKHHSDVFRARVALEAIRGIKTGAEISREYRVHPLQVVRWKQIVLDRVAELFARGNKAKEAEEAELVDRLYREIGELKVELDWLKKKLVASIEERREMIENNHQRISISRQCELVGLGRSSLYYEAQDEDPLNLKLMRLIDKVHTDCPFYGSPKIHAWLRRKGHEVNHKRVERLMRLMEIQALYSGKRPNLSAPGHKVFPYLLRDVSISRVNQVWSADITYIRMRHGFLYLVAIIDWFSRYVLSWELSSTIDAEFCVRALEQCLRQSAPEIFNTDQGSQFGSAAFIAPLEQRKIAISMDGRGRAFDNIFIERLWRTVKYEEVYLKDYVDGTDARKNLAAYFNFYNRERLHQALDYRTPEEVYHATV